MLEGSPAEEEEEQGRRHLTSNVYSEEREKRNERKNIFCLTFLTQGGIYETRFMLLSDGFYFPPPIYIGGSSNTRWASKNITLRD